MLSFIFQVLIFVSILGIVAVLVRKIPGVAKSPFPEMLDKFAALAKHGLSLAAKKTWQFVLEVKELSKKRAYFPKFPTNLPRFHFFPKHLPFFRGANTVKSYLDQAQDCLDREDYLEAERKYIKAIEKDPHSEAAFSGLGKLYLMQNKLAEAVGTYQFLVKHYPENDGYHSSLGRAFHNQKEYKQAIAAYEQAIVLAPNDAKRYINLGLTLEAQGHVEEAILNYRRATDLEKDNPQFLVVLSEALLKKGEKREAEALLEQILQLDPTNLVVREKLMHLKF